MYRRGVANTLDFFHFFQNKFYDQRVSKQEHDYKVGIKKLSKKGDQYFIVKLGICSNNDFGNYYQTLQMKCEFYIYTFVSHLHKIFVHYAFQTHREYFVIIFKPLLEA